MKMTCINDEQIQISLGDIDQELDGIWLDSLQLLWTVLIIVLTTMTAMFFLMLRRIPEDVVKHASPVGIKIVKKLGQGAFGEVYKGIQQNQQQIGSATVAVKVFRGENSAVNAEREWRNLQSLVQKSGDTTHHNITRGIGHYPSTPNFSMITLEYMQNGNLRNLLDGWWCGSAPSWNVKLSLSRQIVAGLQYIHSCNLMHQDLKSDNILLDAQGNARISDFGISRYFYVVPYIGFTLWANNVPGGTPIYLAPEILGWSFATKKSDIYSLGILLYEISTSRRPVRTMPEIQAGQFNTNTGRLSMILPQFKKVIDDCLKIPHANRPTAAEVSSSLAEENITQETNFADKNWHRWYRTHV